MSVLYNYEITNNEIKIDNGPTYYLGKIENNDFPEIYKKNYISIVEKALNNYNNTNCSITCFLEKNEYGDDYPEDNYLNISISRKDDIIGEFITLPLIKIPLKLHKKEKVDYLEEENNKLKKNLLSLTERFNKFEEKISKELSKLKLKISDSDDDTSSDTDNSSNDIYQVKKKTTPNKNTTTSRPSKK